MADLVPILAVDAARDERVSLKVMPGELVLIEARGSPRMAWLADLCCGLVPPAAGSVAFLGRDWAKVPPLFAAALRGRIGRVFAEGGWIATRDVAANVLLPQLHHTRRDAGQLREAAAALAAAFGLPGLPTDRPADLAPLDLARAALVRAFLGEPQLVLLETPLDSRFVDLRAPLLEAIAASRSRGAAVVWLTRSELVWNDPSIRASQRWRLDEHGLAAERRGR